MAGKVYGLTPFTSDQWKELKRQAMIFKYIKESIPVPLHLLLPSPAGNHGSNLILNFKSSTNGKVSEPERCKRTDGKKWRCSKDVAPRQKYCEHHLHRGRSRSRKPVEIHTNDTYSINKKSRFDQKILPSIMKVTPVEIPLYSFHQDVRHSSQRYPDWGMEEQLHHSLGGNIGSMIEQGNIPYTSFFEQGLFQDSQNLVPFSNFESDAYNFFLNQGFPMENRLTDTPHSNESSVFSQDDLSPSMLSLSMGILAENNEMGLRIGDTDCFDNSQVSSSFSMDSSRPGGPLAEVLSGSAFAVVKLN